MKIAIISDSHSNVANFKKAIEWLNKEKVGLILHCGDIGSPESLKESLKDFRGELFGVLGNMDSEYRAEIKDYNEIKNVKISEDVLRTEIPNPGLGSEKFKKIAITHYPEEGKKLALSGDFDLVFYGHTHKPWEEKINVKCRLINPGELAGQIFKPSFALYDLEKDFLELKILEKL